MRQVYEASGLMRATVQSVPYASVSLVHIVRWLPVVALATIVNHNYQEITMNKDQVKVRIKEAKGKVKEFAGKTVGNKDLEQKG